MNRDYMRRRLIKASVGAAALGALPGVGVISFATAAGGRAGMATGFRATTHSMAWFGVETGIFKKLGLNATFETFTPGGPDIPVGLQRGEFEFGQTGTLPTAETVLNGGDAVALLRNTLPHSSTFLVTRREYTKLEQLDGKTVAVISDAISGQTGVRTRLTVEKAGAAAKYVGLGNFQNIYKALAAGEIDAGIMQIHQRLPGQRQYGWNAFDVVSLELPSVFITTRKLIASDRDMVQKVVQGMVETIHFFKTQRDAAIPLLQRFLQIDDRKAVEDLHAFYVPLFPAVPRVDLGEGGIKSLRDNFIKKFPAAAKLQESDIVDSSFIDQLDKSGFIQRLYGNVKL
jgi:ABC-type nitrate/sulfonate/bicarbonate transport system substrate-binding protein